MINFIDNFKKLDKYYTKKNNNPEFRKTVYYDFNQHIFFYKILNKDNIPTFYWSKNERKAIYEYFEEIFIFNSDDSQEN